MKFRSRVEKGVPGRNGDCDWADEGCAISQDDFRTMFSNSEAIYKFHHDFLLPQVKIISYAPIGIFRYIL